MAASDPTYGVPTPTGVLQGVAAFSWDGAAWQPAGRAGPTVSTPTGVLRGVAPFTWGSGAWQPTGRAGPGVPTPTGVLDGVAVYTWSGSAWVPSYGGPSCPTPSGALQGVAAFNWDGTAWQPAGQAGSDVTTPYGVLQGVAMFSWGGASWAPTVAGTAVDINFLNTTTLDARVAFSRGSVATYFDTTGTMQTVTGNTPRFDNDPVTHASLGLLVEEARTNVLLNSATLGTQSVTVTAQAYTLSFYGTGTITKSGTASGALVGTGAFPQRVSQTFTPTAGTLTLTVTGSVTNAQLEAGASLTSYIPTTAAAVTRAADIATLPTGAWYTAGAGSFAVEALWALPPTTNLTVVDLNDGTSANRLVLYNEAPINGYDIAGNTLQCNAPIGTPTIGQVFKVAMAFASGSQRAALNGGTVVALGAGSIPANITVVDLGSNNAGVAWMDGYIRRFRYWPRMLTDAELQQVTT